MSLKSDLLDKNLLDVLQNNADALTLLAPYLDKALILYFYPKDNTPGCTQQACELQTSLDSFTNKGVNVVGVSKDTPSSHKKFSDKFNLSFPLISDMDGCLCNAFDVWKEKSMYGKKYFGIERSTFYIDEKQIIRHIWRQVKVPNHWNNILRILEL